MDYEINLLSLLFPSSVWNRDGFLSISAIAYFSGNSIVCLRYGKWTRATFNTECHSATTLVQFHYIFLKYEYLFFFSKRQNLHGIFAYLHKPNAMKPRLYDRSQFFDGWRDMIEGKPLGTIKIANDINCGTWPILHEFFSNCSNLRFNINSVSNGHSEYQLMYSFHECWPKADGLLISKTLCQITAK